MVSATDVSRKGSPAPNILERLELISLEQPEQTEYLVTTESEAQEILTAMAASLTMIASGMDKGHDRQVVTDYAAQYRLAVIRNSGLELLRELAGKPDDELVIYGLKLVVPVIVLN
jgi:hypothetical protein